MTGAELLLMLRCMTHAQLASDVAILANGGQYLAVTVKVVPAEIPFTCEEVILVTSLANPMHTAIRRQLDRVIYAAQDPSTSPATSPPADTCPPAV